MVSDLLRAKEADEALSEDDIVLLLASLIGAGSEATSQVGTSIVRTLLNQPAALERLRSEPPLIRRSMNEILRYSFSFRGHDAVRRPRFRVRGKEIRKGQMIMLFGRRCEQRSEKPTSVRTCLISIARFAFRWCSGTARTTASAPTSHAKRSRRCSRCYSIWHPGDRACAPMRSRSWIWEFSDRQ